MKKIILIFLTIILLGIISGNTYDIINIPKVYVYNTQKNVISLKNNDEIVLENIYAPSFMDSKSIIGGFCEEECYIGIFNMESIEITNLFSLKQFSDFLDKEVDIQEVTNIQVVPGDKKCVSFIYDGKLFIYNPLGMFEQIWEFQNYYAEDAYEWIDDSQLLLLDDMGILNEWTLYLYNIKTKIVEKIDEKVSVFSYFDKKIFYGKKEYEGSWCEWNMLVMDMEEHNAMVINESNMLDIGEIIISDDEVIYYMEGSSYMKNYDRMLYCINNIWGRKKILEVEKGEKVIGVFEF